MLWPINQPLTNATSVQSPRTNAAPRRADNRGSEKAELQPISGLRSKLLYERYGILENPFGVTPNPRYLYQSRTHGEARSSLIIGIECGVGFQALIAPPGTGKTTILFHVLERFKDVARTAVLFQIHGDSHDFLRYLLSELGSDALDSSVGGMQEAINQLLVREFRSGRRTIIVIDEAQDLDTPVLETIRLLSNFETRSEKLLQIILAGQPQLAQRLANPEMTQLRQRISMLTTLIPFGLEDTRNYIEHRLTIAGYQGPPLFTSAALRLVWERSRGVPREINTLCFNALLLARAAEQKQVDSDILHEVVADLDLDRIRLNTGTPPSGMRGVQTTNGLSLGNTAEDPPATNNDETCKAVVSGAEAEADDASTRPTASDEVDLVELRTTAVEILSTGSGEKADQAAVSDAKVKADDASPRPTSFDGVDLVQLGKNASKRDSTSSGNNDDQAAVPDAGAESDDIVGVFLPDKPASASHRKTDMAIFAGTGVAGAPSRGTEATGSSTDALPVILEALAAEAEWMPEAKHDLSSGVESELSSKGRLDFSIGIKPDLKTEIKPESGSDVESSLEPGVAAVGQLRNIVGKDAVSEAAQQSLWKTVTKSLRWPKQQWESHRATVYLGTSVLVFLLVLTWLQRSSKLNRTMFKELSLSLGLALPTSPVHQGVASPTALTATAPIIPAPNLVLQLGITRSSCWYSAWVDGRHVQGHIAHIGDVDRLEAAATIRVRNGCTGGIEYKLNGKIVEPVNYARKPELVEVVTFTK